MINEEKCEERKKERKNKKKAIIIHMNNKVSICTSLEQSVVTTGRLHTEGQQL
jgi:hypothetical protein